MKGDNIDFDEMRLLSHLALIVLSDYYNSNYTHILCKAFPYLTFRLEDGRCIDIPTDLIVDLMFEEDGIRVVSYGEEDSIVLWMSENPCYCCGRKMLYAFGERMGCLGERVNPECKYFKESEECKADGNCKGDDKRVRSHEW